MKKIVLLSLTLLLVLAITSCAYNRPIAATSNPIGSKVGTYTQIGILYFPPLYNDDSAILKAAENGGITKISTVDYNVRWKVLFYEYETVVTGE